MSKTKKRKKIQKPHKHFFAPAINWDWQGNAVEYGVCVCGETDL